jgi:putative transposase
LKEKPKIQGRIISATVSRKADRWFVSVCVERKIPIPSPVTGPRIGVDLGIKSSATFSDGTKIENPQALVKKLQKLKRLSQQVARKKKGSHNRRKAIIRLARLYWRISNIRMDVIHKLTTYLAKNHSQIVIENLCVKGLMKNKRLSRAIADIGFNEFSRQLEYKTKWYGSEVVIVSQFFPSSKRCSRCGHTKAELSLSERVFNCDECGLKLDRDENAAKNLVAASWAETINACLETGGYRSSLDQCLLMKQEPNTTKT